MSEYSKDELMLLNEIMKLAIDGGRIQKTEGILALQKKLKDDLKEKVRT